MSYNIYNNTEDAVESFETVVSNNKTIIYHILYAYVCIFICIKQKTLSLIYALVNPNSIPLRKKHFNFNLYLWSVCKYFKF